MGLILLLFCRHSFRCSLFNGTFERECVCVCDAVCVWSNGIGHQQLSLGFKFLHPGFYSKTVKCVNNNILNQSYMMHIISMHINILKCTFHCNLLHKIRKSAHFFLHMITHKQYNFFVCVCLCVSKHKMRN